MARSFNVEIFVWAYVASCQLNRIPQDDALIIKQFALPYDLINLQKVLQSFGFTHSLKQYSLAQHPKSSLSCLAILNPASPGGTTALAKSSVCLSNLPLRASK